jgi:hypothetical protein
MGAASGDGLEVKLTFSRTVERRRAAFSSAAVSSATGAGAAAGCGASTTSGWYGW